MSSTARDTHAGGVGNLFLDTEGSQRPAAKEQQTRKPVGSTRLHPLGSPCGRGISLPVLHRAILVEDFLLEKVSRRQLYVVESEINWNDWCAAQTHENGDPCLGKRCTKLYTSGTFVHPCLNYRNPYIEDISY